MPACAGIEDLREKREQILKQIGDEENEKAKIQTELAALTQRLARINGKDQAVLLRAYMSAGTAQLARSWLRTHDAASVSKAGACGSFACAAQPHPDGCLCWCLAHACTSHDAQQKAWPKRWAAVAASTAL